MEAGVAVLRGNDVFAKFADESFRSGWESLYRECPWATIYQHISFTEIWCDLYRESYEPILVVSYNGDRLEGLFAVALDKKSGLLVRCGHPQSEYGVWITRPGGDTAFLARAIPALQSAFPGTRLELAFIPPGTPLEAVRRFANAVMVEHPCGLRRSSIESADESLRKSSNKSRLNRLRASGRVEFVELTGRRAFEKHIDVIAEHCDLRQGAINGELPFQQDNRKREFFLRLADVPGLLHVVALLVGENVAAFHAGFLSSDREHIGLIAHSPFFAKHSPGKLMLLMLVRNLAERGVPWLDLTPGGAYKERFQDVETSAQVVTFFDSVIGATSYRAKLAARRKIRTAMARAGLNAAQLERGIRRLRPRSLMRSMINVTRNRLKRDREMRFYRIDSAAIPKLREVNHVTFSVNKISDLLRYEQAAPTERSKQTFLYECMQRLELGETVYTYVEGGKLLHFAWLAKRERSAPSGLGTSVFFPPNSLVLWDDYTDPSARGRGLHTASLAVRARDVLEAGAGAYINVLADNVPSLKNIERLGFQHIGSVRRRGKRTWSEPSKGALLPDGFFSS